MKEFIQSQGGLIATVLVVSLGLNVLLTGVYNFLGFIKDKTSGDGDNKAHAQLEKIIAIVQKVVEFLSGNPENKPKK
jgi:hypothetical protein